jgi:cell division control protein 7
MQELQDRLPTLSTFIGEPSLRLPTGATLVPNDAKITMLCLQPELAWSPQGDDGTVLGNMTLALVPTNLSDCCSVNLPSLDAEKSKNIDAEVDGKSSRIGESKQASFLNCIVEDSDDLQKEAVHPMAIHAVVARERENRAGERENRTEEDLNLICENKGSPISYTTKRADSIEAFDTVPNQADALQYNCPDAGHHENLPTCGQKRNPLCANACAEVCEDKTPQILFQPPIGTKAASIASQMNRNSEHEALLQEAPRYDCMDTGDVSIIAENRQSKYLNHGEQPRNEAKANVSKNGPDRMVVKQNGKSKKNALPKEDKDCCAAKAQKVSLSTIQRM